ncbi:penicillin-binding transpeptidase domain-containing protein [Kitasatospora sp. NBC_01287]|uniref:penicillin-binding transpeptidase domain-containing protein n=1 Tax=Kitasatospora sp. NBC_01287 TaxID=2903573 RepID=UPI00224CD553|nr:penicillin-binding transpeptidase domain-containing protein [Kitasatospora sp. NBC_01287]MCX4750792.1 penicillin-binding transpeptidase domain-containing protein [Kitasatospora sp. NBC_01287]
MEPEDEQLVRLDGGSHLAAAGDAGREADRDGERDGYPEYDEDAEDDEEDGEHDDAPPAARRPVSRTAVRIACGLVFAGLLTVGGCGAFNLASAVLGDGPARSGPARTASGPAATVAPPTAAQAATAADAFLAAWAKGDLAGAAGLTDDPGMAKEALGGFQQQLGFSALTLTPGGPATAGSSPAPAAPATSSPPAGGGLLTLGFTASVGFAGAGANPWQYQGQLGLLRTGDGQTLVHWAPSVVYPRLTDGESIALRAISSQAATVVTDRKGRSLAGFPSLAPLLAALQSDADTSPSGASPSGSPSAGDGTASATGNGQAVVLLDDTGQKPAQQLFVVSPPAAARQVRLTLDADVQRAAEQALQTQAGANAAGLVAVEPSTGDILAVANAPAAGFNEAFLAGLAPGSTMKVITAAALLEAGDTPGTPVACPSSTNSPKLWTNDEPGSFPGYTLADDFAHSCNTAFINEYAKLPAGTLAAVARDQFGVGLTWSTAPGVPSFDAKIPVPSDPDASDHAAAEAVGQDAIQANALTMASVAATVQNGTFRQPVLLPGQPQVKATGSLPSSVAKGLRAMMAQTAASGTAQQAMAGLSGEVGAKTGTADVGGAASPNSWFIGYRGNLAVAAEVEGGGHGAGVAGSAVAQVLAVGNG